MNPLIGLALSVSGGVVGAVVAYIVLLQSLPNLAALIHSDQSGVLKVREMIFIDSSGKARLSIGELESTTDASQGVLFGFRLYDSFGQEVGTLVASDRAAYLNLGRPNNTIRIDSRNGAEIALNGDSALLKLSSASLERRSSNTVSLRALAYGTQVELDAYDGTGASADAYLGAGLGGTGLRARSSDGSGETAKADLTLFPALDSGGGLMILKSSSAGTADTMLTVGSDGLELRQNQPMGSSFDLETPDTERKKQIEITRDRSTKARRIEFGLAKGGEPYLALRDKQGRDRALLGSTALETKGGSTITRSAGSLTIFDKDGQVSWSTPE